ncbi:uncharacterized protein LOC143026783 [Oratosquilla oratoria]|uniref:uncharacterized protein LOC143026783 n=1 Tax=Oratosquilla oratoria TaxID=337810 RepID=UPI003F75D203
MNELWQQEAWTAFNQLDARNILERRECLDAFLSQLLIDGENGELRISQLPFCDTSSVVTLLVGQFLLDIEKICLESEPQVSENRSSLSSTPTVSTPQHPYKITSESLKTPSIDSGSKGSQDNGKGENKSEFSFGTLSVCVNTSVQSDGEHKTKDQDSQGSDEHQKSTVDNVKTPTKLNISCIKSNESSGVPNEDSSAIQKDGNGSEKESNGEIKSDSLHSCSEKSDSAHIPEFYINDVLENKSAKGSKGENVAWKLNQEKEKVEEIDKVEDTDALLQYLLEGCGAKILVTLDQLGVEVESLSRDPLLPWLCSGLSASAAEQFVNRSLSGSLEICNILAYVFFFVLRNTDNLNSKTDPKENKCPQCLQKNNTNRHSETAEDLDGLEKTEVLCTCVSKFSYTPTVICSIEDMFSRLLVLLHEKNGEGLGYKSQNPTTQFQHCSSRSSVASSQSATKTRRKRFKKMSSNYSHSIKDSDSEEEKILRRPRNVTLRFTLNMNDFEYFNRAIYSDAEKKQEVEVSNAKNEFVCPVWSNNRNFSLSAYELLECITSILFQFCIKDTDWKQNIDSLITTRSVMEFTVEALGSFSYNLPDKPPDEMDLYTSVKLNERLLTLAFASMKKFLQSVETLQVISDLQVISQLLQIVDHLMHSVDTYESQSQQPTCSRDLHVEKICIEILRFASRIMTGLLMVLQVCACLKYAYKDTHLGLNPFRIFFQSGGAEITKKLFMHLDKVDPEQSINLMYSLSFLIYYIKSWRVDIDHADKCNKKHHRHCEYPSNVHHHSQMLGLPFGILQTDSPNTCMVANFVLLLLECYESSEFVNSKIGVLRALSRCGLCCCLNVNHIFEKIIPVVSIETMSPVLFSVIVCFIEKIAWPDLGGTAWSTSIDCLICQSPDSMKRRKPQETTSSDYALEESFSATFKLIGRGNMHSSVKFSGSAEGECKGFRSRWKGVELLKHFVFPEDREIKQEMCQLFLRLMSNSSYSVKEVFCDYVIIPLFEYISAQGLAHFLKDDDNALMTACLLDCARLAVSDLVSAMVRYMDKHSVQLIAITKHVPIVRSQSYKLLCTVINESLQHESSSIYKPESEGVLAELVREMTEQDQFWTSYFDMKAQQVKQRFYIHTQFSKDCLHEEVKQQQECELQENCEEVDRKEEGIDQPRKEEENTLTSEASDIDEEKMGNIKPSMQELPDEESDMKESRFFTPEEFSKIDIEELTDKYIGLSELWGAVMEVARDQSEFRVYISSLPAISLAPKLLVNITQDLARASSGALGVGGIVLDELQVTFALLQALLTIIIITNSNSESTIEAVLSDFRSPLLRYSPRTCAHVKRLVSVMLSCCTLTSTHHETPTTKPMHHQWQEILDTEVLGPQEDDLHQVGGDTEGYEADTENAGFRSSRTSSRASSGENILDCPQLAMLALDLVINHHERFLELKEEVREAKEKEESEKMKVAGEEGETKGSEESVTVCGEEAKEEEEEEEMGKGNSEDVSEAEEVCVSEAIPGKEEESARGDANQICDYNKVIDKRPKDEPEDASPILIIDEVDFKMTTRNFAEDEFSKLVRGKVSDKLDFADSANSSMPGSSNVSETEEKKIPERISSNRESVGDKSDKLTNKEKADDVHAALLSQANKRFSGDVADESRVYSKHEHSSQSTKKRRERTEEGSGGESLHGKPDENAKITSNDSAITARSFGGSHGKRPASLPNGRAERVFDPLVSPVPSLCCESDAIHAASLTQCVHAILLLCRSAAVVCQTLHTHGFLKTLLGGFSPMISANDPVYQGKSDDV